MAKDWSKKKHFNRKSTQQFIVTYRDNRVLEKLNELGSITYKSPVLNVLFIDTYKEKYDLLKVDGVLSVRSPSEGRLLNNKERYYT
ncbi:hypothetical protein MHB40_14545 [Lysinibacillus sp. FSL K6-0057]|uniref:hypothetical protein n=1 Tax=unclassified Lysinibacillus TaxID=2636778 RepID=UPI002480154A|nr:hypothetical protein [Lysinibacillus sp. 1 U-2021]WGT37745.1 hypothetical protein QH639_18165 [Lysinibacillus sp. 1 U-2021]